MKAFATYIAFATLAFAGMTAASAQSAEWDSDQDGYYYYCDTANCYTWWNVGSADDPSWILLSVEPRNPGGRHEN